MKRSAAAFPRAILPDWGFPRESTVRLLTQSENTTFLVEAPDGYRAVCRLHRVGYSDADEIASEHAWIEALRRSGTVQTPAVLHDSHGRTVASVSIGDTQRQVAMFEFMSGGEPAANNELPLWFERLGALTARLHEQSRRWSPPAGFRRRRWTFETTLGSRPHWGRWRDAPGLEREEKELLARAVEAIEVRLAVFGDGPNRFGLVHADLRLANLLVDGDRLGVIDFDDCGFGWFMYDFAASVSFIEHDPMVGDLQHAWAAGYRAVASLAAEEEAMLPVLVMLRRILLTAWIASHPDAETAKVLGATFTRGTLELAERFMTRGAGIRTP